MRGRISTKLYDRTNDAISLDEIERILSEYETANGLAMISDVTPSRKVEVRQFRSVPGEMLPHKQ